MKYFLDGTEITDQPAGDVTTTIKRDIDIGGFVVASDAQLQWHGNGYEYIQSVIDSDGFCGELDCEITDDCTGETKTIYKGKIFILAIKKDENCIITAPLEDDSFYARINKNKSIKISCDSVKSKNGVEIDAATPNDAAMFVPYTGNATASTRRLYRVYDVFKNMIAFMSDDEVGFESTLFGLNGEFEGLSVGLGREIAFPSGNNPVEDSFDNFFKEVRKKINCAFYIDATGLRPILRIEKYQDLFKSKTLMEMDDVETVDISIDAKRLYATIEVGSNEINDVAISAGHISFVEDNIYQTYKIEDYTLLNQCNRDATLDLVSNYIISSNAIEELIVDPTDKWADNIFFVDCENVVDNTTTYSSNAIEGDPFASGTPVFYNTRLMNNEVLDRWTPFLSNTVISFSGTLNNQFRAQNTAGISTSAATNYLPFQFDNDYTFPNFDGDDSTATNNYGNNTTPGTAVSQANSRYTIPEDGNYFFNSQFSILNTSGLFSSDSTIEFVRKDNGGNVLQSSLQTGSVPALSQAVITHSETFTCTATDYIEVNFYKGNASVVLPAGTGDDTYFACTSAEDSRGAFNVVDANNYKVCLADYKYPLNAGEFESIILKPFEKIYFTYSNNVKGGWIDSMKYNHVTGMANIRLIGTQEMIK